MVGQGVGAVAQGIGDGVDMTGRAIGSGVMALGSAAGTAAGAAAGGVATAAGGAVSGSQAAFNALSDGSKRFVGALAADFAPARVAKSRPHPPPFVRSLGRSVARARGGGARRGLVLINQRPLYTQFPGCRLRICAGHSAAPGTARNPPFPFVSLAVRAEGVPWGARGTSSTSAGRRGPLVAVSANNEV